VSVETLARERSTVDTRNAITELICLSALALDEKRFDAYLDLCDPAYVYRITAYSPEIRKEMVWLEHEKPALKTLFANLPRHNSDQSPMTRHVCVYTVAMSEDGSQADVVSTVQAYRTTLDGGATELFAVGKIYDTVRLGADGPKLLDRRVKLDTRMLGIGYHIPL
jgi:methanesulfonate monooxygenase subunit beta